MIKRLLGFQKKHFNKILIIDAALIIAAVGGIVAFSEPAPVQGLKAEKSDYESVELTWKDSENADGYRIYRSDDGKEFHYLESTVDNKFRDVNLRTGNKYYYAVAARNGFKKSKINKKHAFKVVPTLEKPTLSVDTSKGNVELTISKVDGAIAYEISRDGKKIAESMETAYVDKEAEPNKTHKYEVKAVRYRKDPVYSAASKVAKAELFGLQNLEMRADSDDIILSWDSDEHYDQYNVYNGEELLTETTETEYTLAGYELDKIYDIKLRGVNTEDKTQSPALEKRIKVQEEPMDNEGARQAACDWGVMIAADDSFTYGGGQTAHRCGCYFCGTNRAAKGPGYEKTYCCNPFVHACYAHGAGDPQMLRTCQRTDSVGMEKSDYTKYGNWICVGRPSEADLEMGDVLVCEYHVMLYIGDGELVHAHGGGWDAKSITTAPLDEFYDIVDFVMRYEGSGSGTMYKVREVDEKGQLIETEKTDEAESEETESTEA